MIRDEVVARCDVCDEVVTGGAPEQRQEVSEEWFKQTATALVAGYSVQICEDCVNTGRFNDAMGRHPVLGKNVVAQRSLGAGRASAFPRHPRRNSRLRTDVIDAEPSEGDPSADAGAFPADWSGPKVCCEGGPQWGHAWTCPTLPG